MTDLRARIAHAIALVPASKAADEVLAEIAELGHGIYRTADVEALVEAIEADIAVDCIACDCGSESPVLKSAYDRLGRARSAITPELLARCRKGERG